MVVLKMRVRQCPCPEVLMILQRLWRRIVVEQVGRVARDHGLDVGPADALLEQPLAEDTERFVWKRVLALTDVAHQQTARGAHSRDRLSDPLCRGELRGWGDR